MTPPAGIALMMVLLASAPWAAGDGTLIFRNYWPEAVQHEDGSISVTNVQRTVFLPDCVTPAAGSNYLVELRAFDPYSGGVPRMKPVAVTQLGDGARAGTFNGANSGSVTIPFLPGRALAFLSIRIWDA